MDAKLSHDESAWTDRASIDDELDLHEISTKDPHTKLEHQGLLHQRKAKQSCNSSYMHRYAVFFAQLVFFIVSLTMLLAALATFQYNAEHQCGEVHGTYFDVHVNNEYEVRIFEDDLNSPYRGPPTPDVEKRWSDLHNVSYRRMSYDELYESGGPASSIKNVDGTYPATIAAFHQMHCLRMLWQHTWIDWYDKDNMPDVFTRDTPQLIHDHLDHCADIVRQALMCNPDTTPLVWHKNKDNEVAINFGLPRMCRNYDAIVEWGKANEWHKSKQGE